MNYTGEVIDTHVHLIRKLSSVESIFKEMEDAGVHLAVLLGLDLDKNVLDNDLKLKDEIVDDLYAYSIMIDPYRILDMMNKILDIGNTPNSLINNLVMKYPDKFIGYGSINPRRTTKEVKNLIKEIDDYNLSGIKLLPTLQFFKPGDLKDRVLSRTQRIIDKNLSLIFKFGRKKDIPILIHPGKDPGPWEIRTLRCVQNTHPKYWRRLINKYSNNKVIIAHLGGYGCEDYDESWFEEALTLATDYPNVYMDTSAVTYHLESSKVVEAIRNSCTFDKILFGTDSPVVYGSSMEKNVKIIIENQKLSEKEKKRILSENAKELLDIED
ncbi:MAG: amidohydrolase family protein [Candidatus Hodarchaeales archaeon]